MRAWRCGERVAEALVRMERAAVGEDNVLHPMKDALAAGATVGEVCDTLRGIWGTYPPMGRCRLIGGPPERPPLAGGRPPEPPAGWAIPR
ncbi:methylmalonyl-CoA mutase family protein [Streptomyces sp. Wh19]|uniref:methylmalonyl-CoA mutase family protein n=1 Tax=Streptomyces sp. Wh19 TaxID=3076629 RepID=UPI003FA39C07